MVEENQEEEESVVHDDSCTPEWKPSFHYSTPSQGHKAGPSYLHTQARDQLAETSEISPGLPDENLSQTGLSDTAEILDELVREGYLSLADLDLSNSQTAHRSRLDQQESSWMSQRQALAEDERRELRIWMRRKQRERLAVYQKHRGSLREREHKPFSTSGTAKPTNKNGTTIWRTREEKEKFMLLEHYNQRTRDACSLASDFPTNPPTRINFSQTGSPVTSAARSNSAPRPDGAHRAYSVSASDKRIPKSGQDHLHFRPWTAEMQGQPSEDHRKRLGLHRPVTSLPRDRLSQVTRRGMLTDTRSHSKLSSASQSEERYVGSQRKTGLSTTPSGGTAAGKGILREQTKLEEREVIAGLLNETDDGARASVSDMDWLDNLSDTGSSLSKIDWAAIEKIVAEEEA